MSSFAAVITHYQGTQTDEQMQACALDLRDQGELEVHVFHDGPLLRPWPAGLEGFYLHVTPQRNDCWGHDLRRLGLLWTSADYVWFSNADNRLHAGAFDLIRRVISEDGALFAVRDYFVKDEPGVFRDLTAAADAGRDCMQAVFRRNIWLHNEAWTDTSKAEVDGTLIRSILASANYVTYIEQFLGEHH